jgi:hypothetical protein
MCATSPTCDTYGHETRSPWFSWQRMGHTVQDGRFKCHVNCKENVCFPVRTLSECQVKARARGMKYYSYRPGDKMCAPASSCADPKPAQVEWHAFSLMD